MADIPSPLTYGTIIGHYVSFLADSADAGFAPDMDTLNGSVTITSNLRVAQVAATGTNYLAVQKPIVAKIVNGVLYAPDGTSALRVLASDSPGLASTPFQYTATYQISGVAQQPLPVTFSVPTEGTVDLAVVANVTPAAATTQVVITGPALTALVNSVVDTRVGSGTGGGGVTSYLDLTNKPFIPDSPDDIGAAPLVHTHAVADVTGLQGTLDSKINGFADPNADRIVFWDDSANAYAPLQIGTGLNISGTVLTGTGGAPAASETVAGVVELATAAETTTGTDAVRAVHPAGLKVELDKKAPLSHTHTITNVVGLQTALDTKYGTLEIGNPDTDFVAIYNTAKA
jgi:hypothetical protein